MSVEPVEPTPAERAGREALRVHERYAREVVEGFDFCPWARSSRLRGETLTVVIFQRDPADLRPALGVITQLIERASCSVGFLLFPCLPVTRSDFEHYLRKLRHTDSLRYEPGEVPFAMAAFHPQANADLSDPDRLVPFIRRSPDPCLQLVRQSVLEATRGTPTAGTALAEPWMISQLGRRVEPTPTVREKVARNNWRTVSERGPQAIEAVLTDIAQDRARAYAELTRLFGGDGFPADGVLWGER